MIDKIIAKRKDIISEIQNADVPRFLLDDFPVVVGDDEATLNIIFGDAGVGKTLLNQSLMHSLLETWDDVIVVWFDLEYQSSVAKQRRVDYLLENFDNFYLLKVDDEIIEEFRKKFGKEFTNARFVYTLSKEFSETFTDKKIVVFVDSLEDMIDDTSSDAEVKKIFTEFLRLKRITFIFSHHINKKETANSLKFRGSMVIKAKLSSLVYIEKKEDVNDFEAEYSIDIVKMRALWDGNRKILITINKNDIKIQNINKNIDSFEKKVLKSAYFLLRKGEMKKTDLIEAISKQIKANAKSVRAVIEKNSDLFDVYVLSHNKQIYRINAKRIDEFCVVIGIDNSLSDTKKELINLLDSVDNAKKFAKKFEVRRNDGSLVVHTVDSIRNSIYKMSDNEASQIIQLIKNRQQEKEVNEDDIVEL